LPANFVHRDHHAIVMPGKGLIYSANDGGVAISKDGGTTWEDRSRGMINTMFYDVDVAPSNSRIFGGGAQDTGSLIAGVRGRNKLEFTRVLGGDGGWMVFDPTNAQRVFASTADVIVSRHLPGEPWAAGDQLANWPEVFPGQAPISKAERGLRSIVVTAIEPVRRRTSKKVWIGTCRLWVSEDQGDFWEPASPVFDTSAISAIEISTADPRVMFVGTTAGGIFRTTEGGRRGSWSADLAGPLIPKRLISQIEAHPKDPKVVVITVASSGAPGPSLTRTDRPYSHVFCSRDMGQSWSDLDRGTLPNVVFNALAFETHPPYRVFVGGDAGVWMRQGGRWVSVTANMPNVVVSDLVYHHDDRILTAATYGRGIWRLKVPRRSIHVRPGRTSSDDLADPPGAVGFVVDESVPRPVPIAPEDGAEIDFPRNTHLKWKPVPGALMYSIEVRYGSGSFSMDATGPEHVFQGLGMGDARWRVWAVLPDGRRSRPSQERLVTYLR
jgi:hypothetical protein